MVAYRYLFFVRNPVICASSPGCAETSWSTDTQSPGLVAVGSLDLLALVGLSALLHFVAFANKHALHAGVAHLANRLGMIPIFAITFSFAKEM